MSQYSLLLSEIILFVFSCLSLFLKNKSGLGLVAVWTTLVVALFTYPGQPSEILNGMLYIAPFTQSIKVVILAFGCVFFTQIIAVKHSTHLPVLVLFSMLGMLLSLSSNTLPSLYLALELQSMGLYVLACLGEDSTKSAEAGVKYVLLGAFMSAIMLYGISLIFVTSGSLHIKSLMMASSRMHFIAILFFMSGMMFKVAAAPFHVWVGDIYEGSPTLSTTFFAIFPKLSLVVVLMLLVSRLEFDTSTAHEQFFALMGNSRYLRRVLFVSGVLSLFFGTFLAYGQSNIKKFIGFASVTHVGYALLGVSVSTSLSFANPGFAYTLVYAFTNLGVLSVILMLKDKRIALLGKLRQSNILASVAFVVLLFSLAGMPPFVGFWGKAYVIKSLVETNHVMVAVFAMLIGIVSAFYYLRIVKETFFGDEHSCSIDVGITNSGILTTIVVLCALFSTFGFALLVY